MLMDQFGTWGHTAVLREGCGRWYNLWSEAIKSWVGGGNFEVVNSLALLVDLSVNSIWMGTCVKSLAQQPIGPTGQHQGVSVSHFS